MQLHRFTVRPRHLDAFLELWPEAVELRRRHGFQTHQAYVETQAEPKVTWLYHHDDPADGEWSLRNDPDLLDLEERLRPHVFRNLVVRPVDVELLADVPEELGRTVCLRRYSIVGEWDQFLDIWRRIVPVREAHGFRCLFAVADRGKDLFTWAFDFDGTWDEFPELQRLYYRDPARVELGGVFDFMADYALAPAQSLVIASR
ncbi:MAG: hypothetical protein GX596_06600 [Propionibacterium sp.]|nr:hypothetical protein [Propionibacterium sp.]